VQGILSGPTKQKALEEISSPLVSDVSDQCSSGLSSASRTPRSSLCSQSSASSDDVDMGCQFASADTAANPSPLLISSAALTMLPPDVLAAAFQKLSDNLKIIARMESVQELIAQLMINQSPSVAALVEQLCIALASPVDAHPPAAFAQQPTLNRHTPLLELRMLRMGVHM